MHDHSFSSFLLTLGYSDEDLSSGLAADEMGFEYQVDDTAKLSVKYILTPTDEDIFQAHKRLWNKNKDNVFVAVSEQNSYIINAKEKPDPNRPLKGSVCLKKFSYGINSIGFQDITLSEISKDFIDSAYFFDFVSKHQRKGQEVDKDLLLNLLALKNDLTNDGNDDIVHLLILRCIFIKYLEDRGIFDRGYLLSVLKTKAPGILMEAFDEIRKINGDVFKYDDDFDITDINESSLTQLAFFFETDYRSGQMSLFPYQFDQIPIQLISHVYEAFLKGSSKKRQGIYYTPAFLVNFMLCELFNEKEDKFIQTSKCLDPAVGSGAFLVECFSVIQKSYGYPLSFEEKKSILEHQLFGIDIDPKALQIAAFSLYLALLETEDAEFIKYEIKHAHPILPSLIGKTLIHGNAIADDIFHSIVFEFIVCNPPWGSVPTEDDSLDEEEKLEIKKERAAISNKSDFPEYRVVSDFERSQAFLMRFSKWSSSQSRIAVVVKNSIFLNENALRFRSALLFYYQINKFYELSHYNKILFKKRAIGEINGQEIDLGASEPCAVLTMSVFKNIENRLLYISPKLSEFAENFELIQYSERDVFNISQMDLLDNDIYWRALVNGDAEVFDIIKNKLLPYRELDIEARSGFQPKRNMDSIGDPIWKKMIEPRDFDQFSVVSDEDLENFNWNQNLHRKREISIFNGSRIIVPVRPLKSDNYLFRGAYLKKEIIHKDNIISIKFKDNGQYIDDYLPYLAILNSQLIGFIFYHLSIQWGKGYGKRDTLRNIDVERLPIKRIEKHDVKSKLHGLVAQIQKLKSANDNSDNELLELNDLVFEHYGLLEYEKEIITEFYQVNVNHAGPDKSMLKPGDMQQYFTAFKTNFELILSKNNTLKASYHISSNLGAVICIEIIDKADEIAFAVRPEMQILNFVKNGQLKKAEALKVLEENKVKLYEDDKFYIIKSNHYKDWTVRQAIKDAREEIEQFMKHLSN